MVTTSKLYEFFNNCETVSVNVGEHLYHGGAVFDIRFCDNGLWFSDQISCAHGYAKWKGFQSPETYTIEAKLNSKVLDLFMLPRHHHDCFNNMEIPLDASGYHSWLKYDLSQFCTQDFPNIDGFAWRSASGQISMTEIFIFQPSRVVGESRVLETIPMGLST